MLQSSLGLRRSAFTLIEILVVVAIIALLIAILLPSLRNAREQGKAAACGTQLREIFKASLMYAHENNDRLPYFGWYDDSYTGAQWWITQIAKGLGGVQLAVVHRRNTRVVAAPHSLLGLKHPDEHLGGLATAHIARYYTHV